MSLCVWGSDSLSLSGREQRDNSDKKRFDDPKKTAGIFKKMGWPILCRQVTKKGEESSNAKVFL